VILLVILCVIHPAQCHRNCVCVTLIYLFKKDYFIADLRHIFWYFLDLKYPHTISKVRVKVAIFVKRSGLGLGLVLVYNWLGLSCRPGQPRFYAEPMSEQCVA